MSTTPPASVSTPSTRTWATGDCPPPNSPLTRLPACLPVCPPSARASELPSVRVLLVEDDDDHADLVATALERSASGCFTVDRVATAPEAMARF